MLALFDSAQPAQVKKANRQKISRYFNFTLMLFMVSILNAHSIKIQKKSQEIKFLTIIGFKDTFFNFREHF